jgi:upstream activation factor subunit UAF30
MTAAKKKRKPNAAFMKPVQPDDALSAVVGNKAMPRTEVTKKLWAYIKKIGCKTRKRKPTSMLMTSLKPFSAARKPSPCSR